MKLIYFNLRGRAELARLILAEAKEDFEDSRIEWESSEWAALKDCNSKISIYIFSASRIYLVF